MSSSNPNIARIAQTPDATLVHFEPPLSAEEANEVLQKGSFDWVVIDDVVEPVLVTLNPANRHSHGTTVFELGSDFGFDREDSPDEIRLLHYAREIVGALGSYTLLEDVRPIGPGPVEDVGKKILASYQPTHY